MRCKECRCDAEEIAKSSILCSACLWRKIGELEAELQAKTDELSERDMAIEWYISERVHNDFEITRRDGGEWIIQGYLFYTDEYVWDGIEYDTCKSALIAAYRQNLATKGDESV